jgi:hypothetical protein
MEDVKDMKLEISGEPVILAPQLTYTTFSGADILPKLNGHLLGEIQDLTYVQLLKTERDEHGNELPPVTGWLDSIIIGNEPTIRRALKEVPKGQLFGDEFEILYRNEFGTGMRLVFVNAQFTKVTGNANVDAIVQSERFHFVAEDIQFIEEKQDAAV